MQARWTIFGGFALLVSAHAPVLAGGENRFITVGSWADAPNGYTEMCLREPSLCALTTRQAPADATLDGSSRSAEDCVSSLFWTRAMWPGVAPIRQVGCGPVFGQPLSRANPIFAPGAIDRSHREGSSPLPPRGARKQSIMGRALLRGLTRAVNRSVSQRTDLEIYGSSEFWGRPAANGAGDCEDVAIEKRIRLIYAGFDPARLAYAVVFRRQVGLHVVLVARLDDGDYVLDNLSARVRRWSDMPYRWLRVQQFGDPSRWHALAPAPAARA